MRTKLLITVAFVAGAVISASATAFIMVRWHQRQSQMLWTSALQQHLRIASHVNRGDVQALRSDWDRRLPGLVLSVASFGRNEQTLPLLRSTYELLLDAGREIPADLRPALGGL